VGPYVYTEVDDYSDIVYDLSGTVSATLNQNTQFSADPNGTIDQEMWLPNYGGI
jgi:hypothetical protein